MVSYERIASCEGGGRGGQRQDPQQGSRFCPGCNGQMVFFSSPRAVHLVVPEIDFSDSSLWR